MAFSFAPNFVLYFFSLVNSWSRLPIFGLNELEKSIASPSTVLLNLTVIFPEPTGPLFTNSPEAFRDQTNSVSVSACESVTRLLGAFGPAELEYEWRFELEHRNGTRQLFVLRTHNCSITWHAPQQGNYGITLLAAKQDLLFRGYTHARISDYWIVAIGDSFASGEGNPEKSLLEGKRVEWLHDACHRSRRSWPWFVFERLQKVSKNSPVHFTFLACAGAAVDKGILNDDGHGNSQLQVVEAIAQQRGRGPDLIMMAVGGNDVGYSDILGRLFLGNGKSLFNSIEMRLFFLAHELERLGERLRAVQAGQVVIPYYFDITRNEHGIIDSNCTDLRQISQANLRLADRQILRRVNRIIHEKGRLFNWTVVETVPQLFRHGGVCSSESLIRSTWDSVRLQGDVLGAFHPVERAHRAIGDLVWHKLDFRRFLRN